jgi:exopolysaccharide biosynthesis polyprenyl glycosylphosphotransferase
MDVIAIDAPGTLEAPGVLGTKPVKTRAGSNGSAVRPAGTKAGGSTAPFEMPAQAAGRPREEAYKLIVTLSFIDAVVAALGIFLGLTLRAVQRGEGYWLASDLVHGAYAAEAWVFGGAILYVWLMAFFRTYEVENLYRLQFWARNTVKSSALWVLICLAAIALFSVSKYTPRLGLFYAAASIVGLMAVWRLLAFAILIQPRVRMAASARLITIGWNDKAEGLRQAVRNDVSHLCEVVGCVPGPDAKLSTRPPGEVSILGSFSQLPRLVRDNRVTGIVLADMGMKSTDIQRLVVFCQRQSLDFKMIPAYFPALSSGLQIRNLNGVPLLGVTQLPLDKTLNRLAKRLVDIVGALVGMVLSAPIIAVFGALVFIESPGSIFFRQIRMSRSGRTFYIYKIRSMKPNAESASGAVWAKRDDPRRLRVGAFMRRWNVDELPQFLNVLTGEMSLVGPRPERPELVERFKDTVLNYNARHEVKSGLTGWAQIHGFRGDTDLRKRVEHDLYYLENWSLFLDCYIMVGTVFKYKNAY